MAYTLTITENPSYLHIIVTGKNSKRAVMEYLQEVLRECIARQYKKVLIEECLEGPRLDMGSVFDIAKQGSQDALGYFDAIAYVDVNAKGDLMKVAETVAVNRGLPVAVFHSVAEAENWLNKLVLEG